MESCLEINKRLGASIRDQRVSGLIELLWYSKILTVIIGESHLSAESSSNADPEYVTVIGLFFFRHAISQETNRLAKESKNYFKQMAVYIGQPNNYQSDFHGNRQVRQLSLRSILEEKQEKETSSQKVSCLGNH